MQVGLGVDTGGTYTDAVLLNMGENVILSKAKSLTTRNDLKVGIMNAINQLDTSYFKQISLVAVSSTLATNAVVEGKGSRVGLIVSGHDVPGDISVEAVISVDGGHTILGNEMKPLDEVAARKFIMDIKDRVDAFAVSSYLCVRNPEHEKRLKALIQECSDKPIVCGHELTSQLGFNERTLTAVLNAKLIPVIGELMDSIKNALAKLNIIAPIMITKGDGSMMGETVAKDRPVETILSGPAASINGANVLANVNDGIVIDIGGTTTDMGMVKKGMPKIDIGGSTIGGRKTRVKAVDIFTIGLGGDSRIIVDNKKFFIMTQRVIPICIAAKEYPCLKEKIEKYGNLKFRYIRSDVDLNDKLQAAEFFVKGREIDGIDLKDADKRFIDLIKDEPCSIFEAGEILDIHPHQININRLFNLGVIQRIGFTPTDMLHVEGSYTEYDKEASRMVFEIHRENLGIEEGEFIAQVKKEFAKKIILEIIGKLIYEEVDPRIDFQDHKHLFKELLRDQNGRTMRFDLKLGMDIVGIGAPVKAYLPLVAKILGTRLLIPINHEVGNAVGAITGSVIEKVEILIIPKKGMAVMEDPPCIMHSPVERKEFDSVEAAIHYAKGQGRQISVEAATAAGAHNVDIFEELTTKEASLTDTWGDEPFIFEWRLLFTAIGKPNIYVGDAS